MPDGRSIRVFISSTFRDMQLERDELVKRVFPRVRKVCEQRGVTWGEVDLRWGVTDEQKAEGAVLPICLAEIERTRPYFIGLLGQRYGWVPDEVPTTLVEELGWLVEDAGRSVTELEILHGVLRSPEAEGHAYFYLRDPAWVDALPEADRATFVEESPEGVRRLAELRDRVRASGFPTHDYPDPVALGELVLADLLALVDRLYPEASVPDPLARTAELHRAFATARHTAFVERPALAAALDAHLAGDGPPLLVTGAPGVGASALVAHWLDAVRAADPARRVVEHHVEADAAAADPVAMVQRLVRELAAGRTGVLPEELPSDATALRGLLGRALAAAPAGTLLVVDAPERLADVDRAPDLRWLPTNVPGHVRVVVVSSGERPRATAAHRGWSVLDVPSLTDAERRELTARFLGRYAKALDPANVDRLVASERTGNARFLRIVLDELRQHGDHFTLPELIDRLVASATIDDLLEQVLARYERDFERDRPGLVRDAFAALWAARTGLSEAELLAMLSADPDVPLPHAAWAPLHLAAEQMLVSRDGRLGPAFEDLRTAIRDRYLPGEGEQRAAHARVADFFARQELGPRVVDELAWQLVDAGDDARLAATLGDLAFTELAHRRAAADLRRWWSRLDRTAYPMPAAYAGVIANPVAHDGAPGEDRQLVWGVARLLADAGYVPDALALHRHLVDRARQHTAGRDEGPGGDARLRAALVNLGALLWTTGDHAGAVAATAEAADRCRAAGDPAMLQAALGGLALAQRDSGNLAGADATSIEELQLCRDLGDEWGLQAALGNRAQLLRQLGRYDDALDALREQERVCRDLADPAGIARALAGQATVLADRGDVHAALALIDAQVATCRDEGDERGLGEALLNRSVTALQAGLADDARAAATEAEAIARRFGQAGLLGRVLVARSNAIAAAGDWAAAEASAREAELTARTGGQPAQVALALGVIGTARREQGDLAGSRAAHTEELAAATSADDDQAIAIARTNLGNVAIAEQRFDEALQQYAQAEPTFRRLQVQSSLLPLLANRAQVHHALGRGPEAAADYAGAAAAAAALGLWPSVRQWGDPGIQLAYQVGAVAAAESLWQSLAAAARATNDDASLQRALGERALLLIQRAQPVGVAGDATNVDQALLGEAAALLDEQEAICRRTGDDVGLAACVGNRAIVLRYRGDLAGSLACLDEQLAIAQRSGNAQGVLFATANRGEVLGLLGRVPEALAALDWARATAAQYGLAPMVQQLDAMIAALRSRN